jgi:hypothetical protein
MRGCGASSGALLGGRAEDADHLPELGEGLHAEQADGVGGLAHVVVLGGGAQRSRLHGDEADLVGHHVVHLPGQPGAFLREHRTGNQLPLPLPAGGQLVEPSGQLPTGPGEQTQSHRRPGEHRGVDEPQQVAEHRDEIGALERPREEVAQPGDDAADRDRHAVPGDRGHRVESSQRRDEDVAAEQRGDRQGEDRERMPTPDRERQGGDHGQGQRAPGGVGVAQPGVEQRQAHQSGIHERRTRPRVHAQRTSSSDGTIPASWATTAACTRFATPRPARTALT